HAAVRVISEADAQLLALFAADLPVVERVGIYPEDEFEGRLILGDAARTRVDSSTCSRRSTCTGRGATSSGFTSCTAGAASSASSIPRTSTATGCATA